MKIEEKCPYCTYRKDSCLSMEIKIEVYILSIEKGVLSVSVPEAKKKCSTVRGNNIKISKETEKRCLYYF